MTKRNTYEGIQMGFYMKYREERSRGHMVFSPLNFTRIRKLYRLTQNDVARILGVSLSAVKAWERGARNMKDKTWAEFLEKVEF